jgi:hypothetical protein
MSSTRSAVQLSLILALVLHGTGAGAQQQSQSAAVSVSLRVLPKAGFEQGARTQFDAGLVAGEALRVAPMAGVRARMTYDVNTRVRVAGTVLRGPGGAIAEVRFVCAFGDGMTVSAAQPFDCADGVLARLEDARTTTIPLAVGAELSAQETLVLPPGLYRGLVTLIATHPAY